MEFFIDTADFDLIVKIQEKLCSEIDGKYISGITTNPNAMSKINVHNMNDFQYTCQRLCGLVSSIRNDSNGVVYIQHPDSNVSYENLIKWISIVCKFNDGNTKIGLKIPPYINILNKVNTLNNYADVNVTGIADCGTALLCLTYNVKYVSIIPGRMEEAGVDANKHLQFLNQRNYCNSGKVITGSMRTLDGLKNAIKYNTVPTIGTKVFDLIFEKSIQVFKNMWYTFSNENVVFCPEINNINTSLSKTFFDQMDNMGSKLNKDIYG